MQFYGKSWSEKKEEHRILFRILSGKQVSAFNSKESFSFFVKLDVKHAMGINFQLEHSHVSKVNKRRTFRDVKIHVRRSTAVILEHAINLSKKGCMVLQSTNVISCCFRIYVNIIFLTSLINLWPYF